MDSRKEGRDQPVADITPTREEMMAHIRKTGRMLIGRPDTPYRLQEVVREIYVCNWDRDVQQAARVVKIVEQPEYLEWLDASWRPTQQYWLARRATSGHPYYFAEVEVLD